MWCWIEGRKNSSESSGKQWEGRVKVTPTGEKQMKVEAALGRNRAKWLVWLKAGPLDPQGPRFFSFVRDEQWKRLLGIIDLAPGVRVSPLWTGEERRMFLMGLKPGNIKVCLCSQLDISAKEKWQMCNVADDTMPPKRLRLCEALSRLLFHCFGSSILCCLLSD